MSRISTATINVPLTTYARGIMQDRLAAFRLANLICPIVPVFAAIGTYKKFDDRNAFLPEDSARGMGGPRKRIAHEATDGKYACTPHGLEIPVDDFEVDLAGGENPIANQLLSQGKMATLLSKKATGYAQRVTQFVFANLAPVANMGQFSSPDIDPIDQIDEQLDSLSTDISTTENVNVIMSTSVWKAVRQNDKVKKRLGIRDGVSLTRQNLMDGLLYPVNLEISGVVAATSKRGQNGVVKQQLFGGYLLIVHTMPTPTIDDASAFKCFSTSSVLVDSVKTYREENSVSDIHALDWSEDIELTGSTCARLLKIT